MPERINKIATLGGAINAWSKIAFGIIVFIGYCFLTYYQIKGNSSGIVEVKLMVKDLKEYDHREIEIISNRSDKRYNRIESELNKLKSEIKEKDEAYKELIKELYHLKGTLKD